MEHRRLALVILSGMCLVVWAAGAFAAEESTDGEKGPWSEFYDTFHNPTPWLQMGLDFRFRSVYADNIDTLDKTSDDNRFNYQRYRSRWSTKWILGEDVDLNTRLTWEFRTWDDPPRKPQDVDLDEALFDHFNVVWRNMFGMPLTGKIGRQDVILGTGWLVLDGTPLDGSRTIFMDAARFTFDWEGSNTKLDVIYVDNAAESDRWLQPISDENRALTEQDERGAIFYLTNKSIENTQLEAYIMYKNDNTLDAVVDNMPPHWTRKAEIFTFGGAISGTPAEHWKYRVEGAIQTGEKSDITSTYAAGEMQDLEAYGGVANLEYLFNDELQNSVHIGGEYASGDDPSTSDNEQFDLLWAEWPRWSELYIYSYTEETMIAESTNLIRLNVGHKFKPHKQWEIKTDYHAMWADETGNAWRNRLDFRADDDFRGHLITCWAKYNFNKHVKGHLLGEYFFPGDYYESTNDDEALFLRFNLEYTF
jgi:alginate export protein